MRVVLDTNILISAILWKGLPNTLLKYVEGGELTLCLTPKLLDELLGVLARPLFYSKLMARHDSLERVASDLVKLAEMFPDKPIFPTVLDDPDDDVVLACARFSNAAAVVTGDAHLLRIQKYAEIPILTPRDFMKHFRPPPKPHSQGPLAILPRKSKGDADSARLRFARDDGGVRAPYKKSGKKALA